LSRILNLELHCHNAFSNYRNKSSRIPFDCGVGIEQQLNEAFNKAIDCLFITNHNTLDGYSQILEYQQNHGKFRDIHIYPAEEITINNEGHVLAYGITKEIKSGMTLEETLDEISRQNAISCAAHPFAVSNGIREGALLCDLVESFNSNNVDHFSNIVADRFAKQNRLPMVGGSDSHVVSTIGRCVNTVESENNLDSIVENMRHGKLAINRADYATRREFFEHAHYVLSSSKELLLDYFLEHHPHIYRTAKLALNSYTSNPDRQFWRTLGEFALYLSKRVSKKVNIKGYDPHVFEKRSWKTLISMGLIP
jgi:predicted metal-dependent phosphoesterase TrpH